MNKFYFLFWWNIFYSSGTIYSSGIILFYFVPVEQFVSITGGVSPNQLSQIITKMFFKTAVYTKFLSFFFSPKKFWWNTFFHLFWRNDFVPIETFFRPNDKIWSNWTNFSFCSDGTFFYSTETIWSNWTNFSFCSDRTFFYSSGTICSIGIILF